MKKRTKMWVLIVGLLLINSSRTLAQSQNLGTSMSNKQKLSSGGNDRDSINGSNNLLPVDTNYSQCAFDSNNRYPHGTNGQSILLIIL